MRLVSAGPLFFLRLGLLALAVSFGGCGADAPRAVRMFAGVSAQPGRRTVELDARIACRRGFLEQVACSPGTREHESLVVVQAKPSQVQAALLAAGLRSGEPGRWRALPAGAVERVAPAGDAIEVLLRLEPGGEATPIDAFIRDERSGAAAPLRFVFAGSRFVRARDGERFLADDGGSVVGLVTFGDEVVALAEVVPDRVDVEPARWQARTAALPDEGAAVTLVLRAAH